MTFRTKDQYVIELSQAMRKLPHGLRLLRLRANSLLHLSFCFPLQLRSRQKPELSVQTGHAGQVLSIAFTSDSKLMASGSVDKTIVLWDPATGNELLALKGHTGTVGSVAFSPDDKQLASGSADNTIKIWDVAERPRKTNDGGPYSFCFFGSLQS